MQDGVVNISLPKSHQLIHSPENSPTFDGQPQTFQNSVPYAPAASSVVVQAQEEEEPAPVPRHLSTNSVDLLLQFSDLANLRDFNHEDVQQTEVPSSFPFTATAAQDPSGQPNFIQQVSTGPGMFSDTFEQDSDRQMTTNDTNRTDSYDFDIYRGPIDGGAFSNSSPDFVDAGGGAGVHRGHLTLPSMLERKQDRMRVAGKSPKSSSRSHDIISVYSSFEDNLDDDDLDFGNDSESLMQSESGNLLDKIRFSDIKLGKKIGDGTFGEVYEATLWSQPVAVKIMRIKSEDADKANSQLRKFQKEVSIMKTLRHPNIVEYMGISFPQERGSSSSLDTPRELGPKMCIVTELLPNGNLEQLLTKRRLSWKRYFRFAKDIASGLNWLHHKGIIHRDLKPSNLLVTSSYHIKIADFGLSHMKNNPAGSMGVYSVCGTRCYIAPEVLQKKPYDTKADVFSYGVVLCEMVNGNYPFETMESRETYSLNEMIVSGMRPRMPDECPSHLRILIERCWDDNPQNRPTMEEILELLDKFEKDSLAASQVFLDEELDVLPEEIRKTANEDKLRHGEIMIELHTMRARYLSLSEELNKSHSFLKNEITDKRKLERRVKVRHLCVWLERF
jgi:serine/threonine protein kinase